MFTFVRVLGDCPRCRHDDVRRSRRPRGFLMRVLGLQRHRCMACGIVILTPKARPAESERPHAV